MKKRLSLGVASIILLMLFLVLAVGSGTEEEVAENDVGVDEVDEELEEVEEVEEVGLADEDIAFEPESYEGSGDDVITVDVSQGEPFLLYVSGNQESSHFAVTGFDDNDNQTELFVNTTEPYEGTTLDYGDTTVLEIDAPGAWEVELKAIQDTEVADAPGTIEGSGDDVFIVDGSPETVKIEGNEEASHFSVHAYEMPLGRGDLLVNTTDPYDGRSRISSEVELMAITAVGDWEVTFE